MKTTTYNNGMMSRSRHSKFILFDRRDGSLEIFNGSHIKGKAVVTNSQYTKNGKWSNTTYTIALHDDVVGVRTNQGFESSRYFESNDWQQEYTRFCSQPEFGEIYDSTKVPSFEVFQAFVRTHFVGEADRLDTAGDLLNSIM
jgi:hypothetical protein